METKRVRIIYLVLGLFLIAELGGLFFNSGVVPGVNSRADKLKIYTIALQDDKTILPGNIYSADGEVLVKTTEKEIQTVSESGTVKNKIVRETVYADGKAYSQVIGHTGNRTLNPLAESTDKVIKERNAYRLMAFLDDSSYWGDNGLYATTGIDGRRGQSAVLTLDHQLQLAVYQSLSKVMSDSSDIGSAVVLNAKTGEILAMVSFPTYDFNDLETALAQKLEDEETTNLEPGFPVTHRKSVAPGSIFKVLTSVALIDHGLEDFTVKNEHLNVDGKTYYASGYYSSTCQLKLGDTIDMETALNVSSNVYFAQAALTLGQEQLEETAEKFMLKNEDGTDYMELDLGYVFHNWNLDVDPQLKNIVLAQTGFGQGQVELSTLHAAAITQAIANDGKMMKPYIVKRLIDADGKVTYEGEPQLLSEATSKKTADIVTDAMRSTAVECCNLHHLSEVRKVFDKYEVAGKTGTAENGDENQTNNAWYISFAPADDPEYVVVVNQCKTNKSGYRMMPVVADIYEYLFTQY